jgi:NAD(P)H-nitrite reductase large subunit
LFLVVAVGIKPNTGLAEKGNLEIDRENGGIVVNAELQARTDIYAVNYSKKKKKTKLKDGFTLSSNTFT